MLNRFNNNHQENGVVLAVEGELGASEESEPVAVREHRSRLDVITYMLVIGLLVTLVLAALYGWRYGNVDESVAPGSFSIIAYNNAFLDIVINEDMSARIEYGERALTGKFVLAGAEEDSILFELKDVNFADGTEASDAVFFLRMPRSGLQGDFVGPWMVYFSCPSLGVQRSDWVIADETGIASVGSRDKTNAITTQRKRLLDWSSEWVWKKDGDCLWLIAEAPRT